MKTEDEIALICGILAGYDEPDYAVRLDEIFKEYAKQPASYSYTKFKKNLWPVSEVIYIKCDAVEADYGAWLIDDPESGNDVWLKKAFLNVQGEAQQRIRIAKPTYKSKDGSIKDGEWFAPIDDLPPQEKGGEG